MPKGVLIVGLPGTGKSLTAKATAQSLGVPLLKLDAGRIFAGLVGQSEANLRSVIQTAEAIAPCVLWIEELEKAFSGTKSSGSTDGGTTSRVFAGFLTWLQEKTQPVFVVATANDVTQLPPELLRKGRFDELWFVDLPNERERESIWKLVIQRHGRDAEQFDVAQLARITDGFTGSEIEAAFTEALFLGFERDREPTNLDIAGVLNEFVPLSKQMAEQITALRQWAKGRARLATSPAAPERRLRKLGCEERESAAGGSPFYLAVPNRRGTSRLRKAYRSTRNLRRCEPCGVVISVMDSVGLTALETIAGGSCVSLPAIHQRLRLPPRTPPSASPQSAPLLGSLRRDRVSSARISRTPRSPPS